MHKQQPPLYDFTMKDDKTIQPDTADGPSAPLPEESGQTKSGSLLKRMIKRFGVAGFLFFFIKGVVLYILIPLGLFKWFGGC